MWDWNVKIRKLNQIYGMLFFVLATLPLATSANIDCLGKAFHCVNSTHFMICVDIGAGFSSTIDDFVIPCPPTTVCQQNNRFECEFAPITTQAPTLATISYVKQNMQWSDPTKQTHENIISSTYFETTTIKEDYNTISTTTPANTNTDRISTLSQDQAVTQASSVTDNYFWNTSPLLDDTTHKEKRASDSINEIINTTTEPSPVTLTIPDLERNTVDSSPVFATTSPTENVPQTISTLPSTTETTTIELNIPSTHIEISIPKKDTEFLNIRKSTHLSNLVSVVQPTTEFYLPDATESNILTLQNLPILDSTLATTTDNAYTKSVGEVLDTSTVPNADSLFTTTSNIIQNESSYLSTSTSSTIGEKSQQSTTIRLTSVIDEFVAGNQYDPITNVSSSTATNSIAVIDDNIATTSTTINDYLDVTESTLRTTGANHEIDRSTIDVAADSILVETTKPTTGLQNKVTNTIVNNDIPPAMTETIITKIINESENSAGLQLKTKNDVTDKNLDNGYLNPINNPDIIVPVTAPKPTASMDELVKDLKNLITVDSDTTAYTTTKIPVAEKQTIRVKASESLVDIGTPSYDAVGALESSPSDINTVTESYNTATLVEAPSSAVSLGDELPTVTSGISSINSSASTNIFDDQKLTTTTQNILSTEKSTVFNEPIEQQPTITVTSDIQPTLVINQVLNVTPKLDIIRADKITDNDTTNVTEKPILIVTLQPDLATSISNKDYQISEITPASEYTITGSDQIVNRLNDEVQSTLSSPKEYSPNNNNAINTTASVQFNELNTLIKDTSPFQGTQIQRDDKSNGIQSELISRITLPTTIIGDPTVLKPSNSKIESEVEGTLKYPEPNPIINSDTTSELNKEGEVKIEKRQGILNDVLNANVEKPTDATITEKSTWDQALLTSANTEKTSSSLTTESTGVLKVYDETDNHDSLTPISLDSSTASYINPNSQGLSATRFTTVTAMNNKVLEIDGIESTTEKLPATQNRTQLLTERTSQLLTGGTSPLRDFVSSQQAKVKSEYEVKDSKTAALEIPLQPFVTTTQIVQDSLSSTVINQDKENTPVVSPKINNLYNPRIIETTSSTLTIENPVQKLFDNEIITTKLNKATTPIVVADTLVQAAKETTLSDQIISNPVIKESVVQTKQISTPFSTLPKNQGHPLIINDEAVTTKSIGKTTKPIVIAMTKQSILREKSITTPASVKSFNNPDPKLINDEEVITKITTTASKQETDEVINKKIRTQGQIASNSVNTVKVAPGVPATEQTEANRVKLETYKPSSQNSQNVGATKSTPKLVQNDISTASIFRTSFTCRYQTRGRFGDEKDCRKFYICIGRQQPIVGMCPVGTVFSEIKKQCTKNLSNCVRNNQFQCVSRGRYGDFIKNNVYYLCISTGESTFVRYTFQCQEGYYLNKALTRCMPIINKVQKPVVKVSKKTSDQIVAKKSVESSSTKSEKSISKNNSGESGKNSELIESICDDVGKYADPEDCRIYYICYKDRQSEMNIKTKKCDSDEVFHKEKKKCVDSESYECNTN